LPITAPRCIKRLKRKFAPHGFIEAGATSSTVAKFGHLWQGVDGAWRLARMLSFDHQSRSREEGPQQRSVTDEAVAVSGTGQDRDARAIASFSAGSTCRQRA
jgi:hypothetical protein